MAAGVVGAGAEAAGRRRRPARGSGRRPADGSGAEDGDRRVGGGGCAWRRAAASVGGGGAMQAGRAGCGPQRAGWGDEAGAGGGEWRSATGQRRGWPDMSGGGGYEILGFRGRRPGIWNGGGLFIGIEGARRVQMRCGFRPRDRDRTL